jgi:hypothetical protein
MAHIIWRDGETIRKAALPRGVFSIEALAVKPFADGTPHLIVDDDHDAVAAPVSQLSVDFATATVAIIPNPPHAPDEAEYAEAIQSHIDATAQARGYGNGAMLASYVASTVPAWAAEAKAFLAWRDAVWMTAYGILGAVKSGEAAAPQLSSLSGLLPRIEWPAS